MSRRHVTTTSWTSVCFPGVSNHTSASTVNRSTLLSNVVLETWYPLHLNSFHCYLANHPDKSWCNNHLQGIEQGVGIGLEVRRTSIILDYWKSALDHSRVVTQYVTNEIAAGHKARPFTQSPFPDIVGSPMSVIPKKCSPPVKYHIIHELF